MERVKIDLYISDLLYQYDCVIVPDFGGFLTNFASAQIQEAQGKLLPPSKKLSFNRNLKVNDGLLANHIASRKSISYPEALTLVREFVELSEEGLNTGNKVVIEKVGTLYTDAENNICFSPDASVNYLHESFGLESFRKTPLSIKPLERELVDGIKNLPSLDVAKGGRSLPWKAAAAIFLGIMGSGWLALNYQNSDVPGINYSDFNFFKSEPAHYSPKAPTDIETVEKLEGNYFIEKNDSFSELVLVEELASENSIIVRKEEDVPIVAPIDNTYVADKTSSKRLTYHVIGGCFSVYENAESLFKKLSDKGFEAKMVGEHNHLHAVSYSSFATREEALKMLSEVKAKENSAAWLLVK